MTSRPSPPTPPTPPKTRGDCEAGARPCPWQRCRHWLPDGACVLDLAELGGMTMAEVGALLGVTRQRVEQIERRALATMQGQLRALGLDGSGLVEPDGLSDLDAEQD